MAESAFIVRVPEAEPCVAALRKRFDPLVKLGVPAHITVLVPFMPPEQVRAEVLERVHLALGEVSVFSFKLALVGRFPSATYLVPEPAAPFVALTESLAREFPAYPPYGGQFSSVVPHLTVAHGSAAEAELAAAELEVTMRAHGAVQAQCSLVTLLENSSGLWRQMHAFTLPAADG